MLFLLLPLPFLLLLLLLLLLLQRIEYLYLTYGLMFGGGASLAYNPSLTILGLYFKVRIQIQLYILRFLIHIIFIAIGLVN